jgi:hypothetical protein
MDVDPGLVTWSLGSAAISKRFFASATGMCIPDLGFSLYFDLRWCFGSRVTGIPIISRVGFPTLEGQYR